MMVQTMKTKQPLASAGLLKCIGLTRKEKAVAEKVNFDGCEAKIERAFQLVNFVC